MEEFPNVLIVPENDETPEDIVEDYVQIIKYNLDHGVPLEEILYDFFEDVHLWANKQFFINQARYCLQELEDINKYQNGDSEEIDEEYDDFYY